jgi:hypothetical protein
MTPAPEKRSNLLTKDEAVSLTDDPEFGLLLYDKLPVSPTTHILVVLRAPTGCYEGERKYHMGIAPRKSLRHGNGQMFTGYRTDTMTVIDDPKTCTVLAGARKCAIDVEDPTPEWYECDVQ